MHEVIKEKISVVMVYDRQHNRTMPVKVRWQGREYAITELGYHHSVRVGRALHHIFAVSDGMTSFRLDLDTENLQWTLEEISDGLPD